MNENFRAQVLARVSEAVVAGIQQYAEERAEAMRERLSIPVQGRGRNAIRSDPGEHPRKEKGDLVGGIMVTPPKADVSSAIVDVIYTDNPDKFHALDKGKRDGTLAARPMLDPAKKDAEETIDGLKLSVSKNFGTPSPVYSP